LFETLTGKLPYEADTPMGRAVKHITEPVPRLLMANPILPLALAPTERSTQPGSSPSGLRKSE
jgi:hypothetical protein